MSSCFALALIHLNIALWLLPLFGGSGLIIGCDSTSEVPERPAVNPKNVPTSDKITGPRVAQLFAAQCVTPSSI
jgi:hypothetical protein